MIKPLHRDKMENPFQEDIFNAMMSRQTKITIGGIEITWTLIEGTIKNRERKAKKQSAELAKLLND